MMLTEGLVEEAIAFLSGRIRRTPVEFSPALSALVGVPVWLKLEFLQLTGSFKLRGALFRLSKLSKTERRLGFVTSSAGNHGKAVAYAAKQMGLRAVVCVPSTVDDAKYRGIVELGADVRRSPFPGYDATEDWAIEEAARQGLPFVSPYDDEGIIAAGGGSLAAEVLEDVPAARTFLIPTGGGGLAAGFAFQALSRYADSRIVCCQHERSPGLLRSIEAGQAVRGLPAIDTSAGAIEGGVARLPFEVLRDRVGLAHIAVALVDEAEIEGGVRWMLEKHQYLIEPASAAAVAAALKSGSTMMTSPTVIVLTGRNVSTTVISRLLVAHVCTVDFSGASSGPRFVKRVHQLLVQWSRKGSGQFARARVGGFTHGCLHRSL
jgi:threonine dehydratase